MEKLLSRSQRRSIATSIAPLDVMIAEYAQSIDMPHDSRKYHANY